MGEPVNESHEDGIVTRRELKSELKSFRNEVRILLLTTLVVLKFNVPDEATVTAVGLIGLKMLYSAVVYRFSG